MKREPGEMVVTNIVILKNRADYPQDGNLVDRASKVLAEALGELGVVVEHAEAHPAASLAAVAARLESLAGELADLKEALESGVAAEFTA